MSTFEYQDTTATLKRDFGGNNTDLLSRAEKIQEKYRNYFQITFGELGIASRIQTEELSAWALQFEPKEEEIAEREKWYEKDYANKIVSARALNKEFFDRLDEASTKKLLSEQSRKKWINRFRNPDVSYREKEYWVQHQMPHYMTAWQTLSEERSKLIQDPEFKDLLSYDPTFAVIGKEEDFLDLHYELRKGLLATARAALLAAGKLQLDLFAKAKDKLQSATVRKFLAEGKVGVWLERIFKSNAKTKKIEAFVNGTGTNSLSDLMIRWFEVHERYEKIASSFKKQRTTELPRGAHLISPTQFLNLHYTQRLRYVEEMENRLSQSWDLSHEPDSFIKIRHAIDTKDWFEAALLIEQAKQQCFPVDARARLDSMSRYVVQFSPRQESNTLTNVDQAKLRLDHLVGQLGQSHSELQPMIVDLLRGPHANRSIAQFRWIVYNYDWCTIHGYLNYEKARQGASRENEQRTRERTDRGEDTGRNDVIGATTADSQCIRKREYATHKATFHHVDISNGDAINTTAKWLKEEQDPRDLYWRTFIGNEKGVPKSHNWHKDLFMILTEMRSLTRVVGNAGFMYNGTNEGLKPLAT